MKIILIAALAISAAMAEPTVTAVKTPLMSPVGQQHSCLAVGFNADDTVSGFCSTLNWGGCSGRGCQPTYTSQVYDMRWNTDTSVISAIHCGQLIRHNPSLLLWTYEAGYSAANCYAPNPNAVGPQETVFIAPWDQYAVRIGTSADGLYGLWQAFGTSWIGAVN